MRVPCLRLTTDDVPVFQTVKIAYIHGVLLYNTIDSASEHLSPNTSIIVMVLPPYARGFDTELEPSAQAVENYLNGKPWEPANIVLGQPPWHKLEDRPAVSFIPHFLVRPAFLNHLFGF